MVGVGTLLFLAVGLVGSIVLLSVGTFLFQAGCALADVPGRGYFRSLGIYFVSLLVCLPLTGMLIRFAGELDLAPNEWFGGMRIAALMGSLLLTWVLSAVIFSFFLPASVKNGLLIAAIELLLLGLLTALVSALVLVVLAVVQIIGHPPPVKTGQAPLPIILVAAPAALT